MSMYTKQIRLDVTPGAGPQVIHVSQYDKNSRTFEVELFATDAEFTFPTGATVAIIGTKPDGHGFDIAASISGERILFGLDEQMTPIAGRVPCKLTLTKSGEELLTERFILSVDRTAMDLDTIRSDSKIRQVEEIAEDFDEIIAAAQSIAGTAETVTAAKQAA